MIIVALIVAVLISCLIVDPRLYMSVAGLPTTIALILVAWWIAQRLRRTRSATR